MEPAAPRISITFFPSLRFRLGGRSGEMAMGLSGRRDDWRCIHNSDQVALYSSVRHYLETVQKAGTDEAGAVTAAMREAPIHDIFTDAGTIRPDGRVLYDGISCG